MKKFVVFLLWLLSITNINASYKVYLVHGYGGMGVEFFKIKDNIIKSGFLCETFTYPSLTQDIFDASQNLYLKVKNDQMDTVSFITHSMGGLVVRSLSTFIDKDQNFPYVHRTLMIVPPNLGSDIADYFSSKKCV